MTEQEVIKDLKSMMPMIASAMRKDGVTTKFCEAYRNGDSETTTKLLAAYTESAIRKFSRMTDLYMLNPAFRQIVNQAVMNTLK